MWHEARRREKVTQKLFNDHKKRAEKRREENRINPANFLKVDGVKSNLHIDSNIYKQATKSLVAWQGDKNVIIDRFDVRANLSSLPTDDTESSRNKRTSDGKHVRASTILDADESETMKKLLNYERYRLLIQNDLNKVPEEKRIKLVARSDFLDDAKLKKLQNNWFGTSGEAITYQTNERSYSISQQPSTSRKKPGGVSIAFNYNQTAQVAHSSSSTKNDSNDFEGVSAAQAIIDLDDFDANKLDLDGVDKSLIGTKKTNEVTLKYGIDCDEFNLLVGQESIISDTEITKSRVPSAADLIKELKRLIERKAKLEEKMEYQNQASFVYGPVLPPELQQSKVALSKPEISPPSSPSSSSSSSLIRQRSPSGAAIPLRNGDAADNDSDDHASNPLNTVPINSSTIDAPPPQLSQNDSTSLDMHSPVKSFTSSQRLNVVDGIASASADIKQPVTTVEPGASNRERRASTPLCYKRYQRSSRSISQERASTKRRGHSRDRYNRRDCSVSSSESSSRLTGSRYSYSSSSESYTSRYRLPMSKRSRSPRRQSSSGRRRGGRNSGGGGGRRRRQTSSSGKRKRDNRQRR